MIADHSPWQISATQGEVARCRPRGNALMRLFSLYLATGLMMGFLVVVLLCFLGAITIG